LGGGLGLPLCPPLVLTIMAITGEWTIGIKNESRSRMDDRIANQLRLMAVDYMVRIGSC